MDQIANTTEDILRVALKTDNPAPVGRTGPDFSHVLARHVGQGGDGRDSQYPETARDQSDSPVREIQRDESARDTWRSENTSGERGTAAEKTGDGTHAPLPVEGEMTSGLQLAGGLGAISLGLEPGMISTANLDGPVPSTVNTLKLATHLAGEITARYSDQGGTQTLTMRLDPAHLGKVDVTMVAKGDHLTIRLDTANREAETSLRNNLKDLTDAIGAKNGRFNQIDVKVQVKADTGSQGGEDSENPEDRGQRQESRKDQYGQDSPPDHQNPDYDLNDHVESGSRTQGG